jgi:putative ABC transport system permease protein
MWLQHCAVRVAIGWWVFVLTGAGAALIAFISIGSQSVKAAISGKKFEN